MAKHKLIIELSDEDIDCLSLAIDYLGGNTDISIEGIQSIRKAIRDVDNSPKEKPDEQCVCSTRQMCDICKDWF